MWAATYLLHASVNACWFGAGMKKDNVASLMSFLSCGYKQISNEEDNVRVMLNYEELRCPSLVSDISLSPNDAGGN